MSKSSRSLHPIPISDLIYTYLRSGDVNADWKLNLIERLTSPALSSEDKAYLTDFVQHPLRHINASKKTQSFMLLGLMQLHGIGCDANRENALIHFKECALENFAPALYKVFMDKFPHAIQRDHYTLLKQAADHNYAPALVTLAINQLGDGYHLAYSSSNKEARESPHCLALLKRAANEGYAKAWFEMGNCSKDIEKTKLYFKRAIEAGYDDERNCHARLAIKYKHELHDYPNAIAENLLAGDLVYAAETCWKLVGGEAACAQAARLYRQSHEKLPPHGTLCDYRELNAFLEKITKENHYDEAIYHAGFFHHGARDAFNKLARTKPDKFIQMSLVEDWETIAPVLNDDIRESIFEKRKQLTTKVQSHRDAKHTPSENSRKLVKALPDDVVMTILTTADGKIDSFADFLAACSEKMLTQESVSVKQASKEMKVDKKSNYQVTTVFKPADKSAPTPAAGHQYDLRHPRKS